jgi:hypothetical protein
MKIFQVIPFLFSLSTITLAQSFCNSNGHSGQSVKTTGNKTGKIGSIDYEIWADGGNNSAEFYSDGSFSCSFNNSKDYLCRTGVNISPAKNPSQIGQIKAEFKVEKKNTQNVGYSYVGVYGWTLESGISGVFEFYIVDNWLSQGRPGDWVGNEKKGNFNIDGGEYTVYKNVKGNLTQYFSLRTTPRTCGTIDVTAHFNQWEKIGMKMGKISEIKVLAEAGNTSGGCSGTVDFPYAKIYVGNSAPAQNQTPAQGNMPPQQGQNNQFPQQGQNNQFPPQGQNNQFPPQGQNNQFPPQGQNNQFPPQGQNNQFPPQGQNNQFPPQGQNNQFPPQGQNNQFPPQGQNNQFPPQNNAATSGGNGNCAGAWAQCGGSNFNGPTCCQTGTCVKVNEYYSQCKA